MTALLLPILEILPPAASNWAEKIDFVFWFVAITCLLAFILVEGILIVFVVKYRRRKGEADKKTPYLLHNTNLEIVWTLIPTIIVIVIFYIGAVTFVKMRQVPANAMQINVNAKQWAWEFSYENGKNGSTQAVCEDPKIKNPTDCEKAGKKWNLGDAMVLPMGKPIKLWMTSSDVLHSFYVPEFRVKQDVVPGMYQFLWFEATRETEKGKLFKIFCAEYCGLDHAGMIGQIKVVSPGRFDEWVNQGIGKPGKGKTLTIDQRIAIGQKLYAKKGCVACHTLDGSKGLAPSFKGIFGRKEKMKGGKTITVDEEYLRESILDPSAKVVAGFQAMVPQAVSEDEVRSFVEWLRTVK